LPDGPEGPDGSSEPASDRLAAALAAAGFVAAQDEARELVVAAGGDPAALHELVERRLAGEPLAWLTGRTPFDGLEVRVDPGVYVPRWQSVSLARRAAARLPERGTAIDLCTGSGAVALVLRRAHPGARVVATDTDGRAVACARANGVEAYAGDLFAPVPAELEGRTDVVVAVVPYVPRPALHLLPRGTLDFEDVRHYDGGPDGTAVLERVATEAPRFLRPGGALLLELGGDQADLLRPLMERLGYGSVVTWADDDGDLRGLAATRAGPAATAG
jgi:release factor glutamine methyltransferase